MDSVRSIMTTDVKYVHPDTRTSEAVRLLLEHDISGLPVVTREMKLVGVLSELDVLRAFHTEASKTVDQLMTPNPIAFPVKASLIEVVECLLSNSFRRVFIHRRGKLVGLITRGDLMPHVLEVLLERETEAE